MTAQQQSVTSEVVYESTHVGVAHRLAVALGSGLAVFAALSFLRWGCGAMGVDRRGLLSGLVVGGALALGMAVPRIAVGAPANLVLLDLEARWQVTEAGFRSKSANSWLLGETLQGQPRLTIAVGHVAHDLGAVPA